MKTLYAVAVLLCLLVPAAAQSTQATEVWRLEHRYWDSVKSNDLQTYRSLWNENFTGWPYSRPQPATKAHITDWITDYTSKGRHLDSFTLKQAATVDSNGIVITYYWITQNWVDKDGKSEVTESRITHTWVKAGDTWQILGGMSAVPPANNATLSR